MIKNKASNHNYYEDSSIVDSRSGGAKSTRNLKGKHPYSIRFSSYAHSETGERCHTVELPLDIKNDIDGD